MIPLFEIYIFLPEIQLLSTAVVDIIYPFQQLQDYNNALSRHQNYLLQCFGSRIDDIL